MHKKISVDYYILYKNELLHACLKNDLYDILPLLSSKIIFFTYLFSNMQNIFYLAVQYL